MGFDYPIPHCFMREYKMEKTYKYRIYPNRKQKTQIQKTFGCVRFVYNYYLNKRIEEYKKNGILFNFYMCSKDLTRLKKELIWLKDPDKDALQKALKDLDFAYKDFFKKVKGYPKFKSKKEKYQSYRTNCSNNNIRFVNKHIKLPKLGFVKIRDKRVPSGRILNATISQEPDGHYYCALCCTDISFNLLPQTNSNVGIDLGITNFAIFSNREKIENPHFYENSELKIATLQRKLSRKTIGSKRWEKNRVKIAKIQKHIANQRKDFLQKLTTKLIKTYDVIAIEDLNVKAMQETKIKTRNKRVFDVSWASFRKMLIYKATWYGKRVIVINRYYPSTQICHCCGHRDEKKPENIKFWTCPKCNANLDRDVNAAINILNEALKT